MAEVTQAQGVVTTPQPSQAPATPVALDQRKKDYKAWLDATQSGRTEAQTDRDYYDCKQLSAKELEALRKRGQPDIIINRVKPEVNGTVGVVEKGRVDPRAYAKSPEREPAAEVATDSLRYVADYTRLNPKRTRMFENLCIEGLCAAIVEIDEDREVCLRRIRWEEFFYDPRSREVDFSDARFMGIAKWMDKADVAARYPQFATQIDQMCGDGTDMTDQTTSDRPLAFIDRRLQRLLVVEEYYRGLNGWERCIFCGDLAFEAGPSPYLDARKRPSNPIEAQSGYIDKDNNRYGIIRDMRGPQDEINKRRSKLLHLLTVRQVKVRPAAVKDMDELRRQLARPDGIIEEMTQGGIEILDWSNEITGQAELLAEAKSEIERMGPNPAVLGRQTPDASGRALLARQQAGLVELALLFGGFEDFTLRLYRQFWARIRQYWDEPRYIRVTDDVNAAKYIAINVPMVDPQTGQPAIDPRTGQPQMQNALAEMDMDIVVESTPDTATLQQDQFEALMNLVQADPPIMQALLKPLIMASSIPNKRQVLEALDQAQQAQAQQPPDPLHIAKVEETKASAFQKRASGAKDLADTHNVALTNAALLSGQPDPNSQPSQPQGQPLQ